MTNKKEKKRTIKKKWETTERKNEEESKYLGHVAQLVDLGALLFEVVAQFGGLGAQLGGFGGGAAGVGAPLRLVLGAGLVPAAALLAALSHQRRQPLLGLGQSLRRQRQLLLRLQRPFK